jgi:hypothetical protein
MLYSIFHVNRFAPYWDNSLDKPSLPDLVMVKGKEEYKVDKITDSHIFC